MRRAVATRLLLFRAFCRMTFPPLTSRLGADSSQEAKWPSLGKNVADSEEFSVSLTRMLNMLDRSQMAPDTVTLVFDKGSAALANTVQLQEAGVGWISALPWNQAPVAFRERAVEQLTACSCAQPGVRLAAEKLLVHGKQCLAF